MTSTIVPSSFYSNNNNNNNTNSKSRRSTLQLSTIQEEVDTVVPDSTTTPQQQQQLLNKDMNDFHVGEDVLVKQKDGRYYLGTIVEVSCLIKECLVKFGDNTDRWAKFKTLTKLNTSEQDDLLLCVVCKKSSPKCQNDIIICDQCGRGYHQYCHHPKIAEEYQKEEAVWLCRRCLNVDPEKRNKSDWKLLKNRKSKSNHNKLNDATVSTKTLPYELTSLSWDTYHRVNNEHVYCYCGEGGEWYKQMLQCGRCRQWFHERCIDCLQYPLYCGDRFYVFVCSICNHGKEFLRRLEMKWVDLVHLMLFNLTAYNSRKYYDLDTTIIPYINDNWHALQLPPKISAVSKSERRENILSILTNNRNRFKCGREIKKRVTIWGLRVRLPPPAPTITLNFNGPITEEQLRERWQGNRRLQFLSNHNNFNNNDDADDDDDDGDDDGENNDEDDDEDDEIDENEDDDDDDDEDEDDYELYSNKNKKLIPFDKHMKNVMMGVAYQHSNNQSETDSPCPSPEVEQQQQQQDIYNNHNNDNLPPNTRGCAKKTATITERRKRLLTGRSLRKTKQRRNTNDGICGDTTIIDDTTRVYPTRLSLDNKNYQKNNQETTLPLTPPTSVSAPPTPPALSTTTSLLSDVSNDFGDSNSLDKQLNSNNNNNNNNNHHNTPYDTSGDETSSKSTLDLIIPPPKDFEGKNNPFLTLLRSTNEQQKNKNKTNKKKDNNNIVTSLPLPLTAVIPGKPIMRPTKRQLSEKDIFIGPNGEVKRKRLRRNRNNNNNNNNNTYSTNNCGLITASKTATVLPVKPDAKEWAQLTTTSNNINNNNTSNNNNNSSSIDYSFNGRKLRQRPDKIQTDKEGNNSNNNGNNTKTNNNNNNNSNNNGTDMVDLKSSVNIYFGAANRIATGEKFTIKAKRIGPNGKLEFLIEWDGGSNGMT